MQYFVLKSGFEILDACRAYGLAEILYALGRGEHVPLIEDAGQAYRIGMDGEPSTQHLSDSERWQAVLEERNWQQVFLTYKKQWTGQRDKVRDVLEKNSNRIVLAAGEGLAVDFDGRSTLPGPLEPCGFKGLKGLTTGDYAERPTQVDEINWALGCLGAAVAQRYRLQRVAGNKWEYYVTLPVPENLEWRNFLEVRGLVYEKGVSYHSVRTAVAHFSVLLADAVRDKADGNPFFPARFSGVLYFSLFPSGNQYKPAAGGVFQLGKLMNMALSRSAGAEPAFKSWDYLFRRGSVQGAEDLADAITELVMAPSLDTYYRHARVFLRYIVDPNRRVKAEFLYSEEALWEVMNYAT